MDTEVLETLRWPGVVLVVSVVAILVFRRNLAAFIDRTRRISRDGLEAAPAVQEPPPEPSAAPNPTQRWPDTLEGAPTNPLVLRVVERFREGVETVQGEERENVLFVRWASAAIEAHFERVYSALYFSQYKALTFLNSIPQSVSRDQMRTFYAAAVAANPSLYAGYSFDRWLDFLVGSLLVEAIDDSVTLTLDGQEFLVFIVRRGYVPMLKVG